MPIGTYDTTPGLTPLAHFGVDVPPGETRTVASANPARVKVEAYHTGTTGRLWFAFDQAPQIGRGVPVDPGAGYSEFTAVAIQVLNTGDTTVRVSGVEWGA